MNTAIPTAGRAATGERSLLWSPAMARLALVLSIVLAAAAGVMTTDAAHTAAAVAAAGDDFARLLRSMAVLKAGMAAGAAAAVWWRLGLPIHPVRFAAYALSCAAMAAGPGMIWGMERVGAGALLLHGGLAAAVVMVWRDPAVSRRLAVLVEAKRARLRNRA
jgi:hypothetical protein